MPMNPSSTSAGGACVPPPSSGWPTTSWWKSTSSRASSASGCSRCRPSRTSKRPHNPRMPGRAWLDAVLAAGATAAGHAPDSAAGRADLENVTGAEPLEDPELQIHSVPPDPWRPATAAFLDGVQQWRVVAYDGIVPIVRAWVAAAVRRRGKDRRLRTVHEDARELVVTFVERLS